MTSQRHRSAAPGTAPMPPPATPLDTMPVLTSPPRLDPKRTVITWCGTRS